MDTTIITNSLSWAEQDQDVTFEIARGLYHPASNSNCYRTLVLLLYCRSLNECNRFMYLFRLLSV